MNKKKKVTIKSMNPIKCRATRSNLRNGTQQKELWGIRVNIAHSQRHELKEIAESINDACSVTVGDVLGVWSAMEHEIKRILGRGGRVSLGNLGTLSLEVGTQQRKSFGETFTNSDIIAKGVKFQLSKELMQFVSGLTVECDGIVKHPLSELRTEKALDEHFSKNQYLSARTYATLCHCSISTAYRRLSELATEGKLVKSWIAKGLYERADVREDKKT